MTITPDNAGPENAGPGFEQATLSRSLPCAACGYDLRGLPGGGVCPECGFEVWESIAGAIDPKARRLPSLHSPRRVGDALLALVALLLMATLLLVSRPLALLLDAWALPGVDVIERRFPVAAGLVYLLAVWPLALLAPPAGAESGGPVRRDLTAMAIALGLVAAACLPVPGWSSIAPFVMPLAGIVALVMLRRVLLVIGERSRQFRTARGSRQRVRELIAAVAGAGIGRLLVLAAPAGGPLAGLAVLGNILIWTCGFMLAVGLVYLTVNATWIRHAVRKPPPVLRELFPDVDG